jgi:hypothetical protein
MNKTSIGKYYEKDFHAKYIQYPFDKLFVDNGSTWVNDDMYLQYKSSYYKQTKENADTLSVLQSKLQTLLSSDLYFIDLDTQIRQLKIEIKHILISQHTLFKNLLHHMNYLNSISTST